MSRFAGTLYNWTTGKKVSNLASISISNSLFQIIIFLKIVSIMRAEYTSRLEKGVFMLQKQ